MGKSMFQRLIGRLVWKMDGRKDDEAGGRKKSWEEM